MDFPSNSNKQKQEANKPQKKAVEKVVSGEVITQKKSVGEKFKSVFLGGEFKSSMKYIAAEVLLPAFRNMIVDATTKGVERVIYGDSTPRRPSSSNRGGPRVSYNAYYDRPNRPYSNAASYNPRQSRRQEVSNFILADRAEAEIVMERLTDLIDKFDVASVADLHDLVGLPATYVDNKWGWSSLAHADIRQVREGFLLDLPPIEPI
jgi:hypothetical protein